MKIKQSIRRPLVITISLIVCMLLAGIFFVTYFMHAVYEVSDLLSPHEVPPAVRTAWAGQYPGVKDMAWENEDGLFLAVFAWRDQEELEVYYHADGSIEKTERAIAFAELPEPARQYLEDRTGYTVKDKERVEFHDGRVIYEVEIVGKLNEIDCVFDAFGNLLRRERDGSTLETPPGEEEDGG